MKSTIGSRCTLKILKLEVKSDFDFDETLLRASRVTRLFLKWYTTYVYHLVS